MEISDLAASCAGPAEWRENSTKEQWHLPALLSLGRGASIPAPLAISLKLVNLVPYGRFLAFFELLPLCWSSEWVSLWADETVCVSASRTHLSSGSHLSRSDTIPTDFHMEKLLETPLPGTGALAEKPHMGLGPLSPQRSSTDEISLLILTTTLGSRTCHCTHSTNIASSLYPQL